MDSLNTLTNSSIYFLSKATEYKGNEQYKYYSTATIAISWALLEAYVSLCAESLSKGRRLQDHEKAFILEKELRVDKSGRFKEHTAYPPTLKKSLFLINLFSKKNVEEVKRTKLWSEVKDCEQIRNEIIHPKGVELATIPLKKLENYRKTIVAFIKYLNRAIFRKNFDMQ